MVNSCKMQTTESEIRDLHIFLRKLKAIARILVQAIIVAEELNPLNNVKYKTNNRRLSIPLVSVKKREHCSSV